MKTLFNLVYKELRIAAWVVSLPFMFILAALILIPSYPAIVSSFYCTLCILNTCRLIATNKDLDFTLSLPVSRAQMVTAKNVSFVLLELTQFVCCLFFALIADLITAPQGNSVGIDPNLAYFGFLFICYGVFNLIFMPLFFRSGIKTGVAILFAMVAFFLVYGLLEVLITVLPPGRAVIDSMQAANFGPQAVYLAAGIVFYALSFLIANKLSVRLFEKVNL
jgi:hypothetical protein